LFCDGGIGSVQKLSERCFFACPLDGSIVIEGLGEKVDFVAGLSDAGLCGFGGGGAMIFMWHSLKGEKGKW